MPDVGIVVVSHSRSLAEAAVALSREMLQGKDVAVEVAAGLDDGSFGTDAMAIMAAIEQADRGDGVVVLMDLGSAVLSTEMALEFLDDAVRERVTLCPAPLVEGLVVAVVAAGAGLGRDAVAAEALDALMAKQSHLGAAAPSGGEAAAAAAAAPTPSPESGAATVTASFTVTNPHGLHARPAARLVQEAAGFDARVELRNATTSSAWVPATSLSKVATLGVLSGHEVEVRAVGAAARAAVDGLVALAARSFDEPAGQAPASLPAPRRATSAEVPVAGSVRTGETPTPVPASPGIGIGPATVLRADPTRLVLPADAHVGDADAEHAALTEARAACRAVIAATRRSTAEHVGEGEAQVFDAHLLLLDDPDLVDEAEARVAAGEGAAAAWAAAVARVESAMAALPDPYLQARAADVRAVGDQVLRELLGITDPAADLSGRAGVLVAEELTPAQAAGLDPGLVVGLVLAYGSPTAHSAILARARGVPAVVGAGPEVLDIVEGTVVALDGATGELVVDPAADVLARMQERAVAGARAREDAAALASAPAVTRDGVTVLVGANIGSVEDAREAARFGADLAGLVRTEFLFLGRQSAPDVDEQEQVYVGIAEALGGRRITLRTLDVGGDKPLPYLPMPAEDNPFLGVRGIRLCLARPELFADQLLAVVRTAHRTPVNLMFPMVGALAELTSALALLDDAVARDGRPRPTDLEVGIMVEVPGAALRARTFAPHVDFFSIGTNDLTQYVMAADRGNPAVTALGDAYDPAVLGLVRAVCEGAGDALVAVCGELAADERAAAVLVGLGVRELSMSPRAVPGVKQALRQVDVGAAQELAATAMAAGSAGEVRRLLAQS